MIVSVSAVEALTETLTTASEARQATKVTTTPAAVAATRSLSAIIMVEFVNKNCKAFSEAFTLLYYFTGHVIALSLMSDNKHRLFIKRRNYDLCA